MTGRRATPVPQLVGKRRTAYGASPVRVPIPDLVGSDGYSRGEVEVSWRAGWSNHLMAAGYAATTRTLRLATMDRFARWLWRVEGKSPLEATAEDLERWLAGLRVAAETKSVYISGCRSYYRWAHERGLLAEDPTLLLRLPRPRKRRPRPIDVGEFRAAWEAADTRMRCWLGLAGLCGLRVAEIAGARGENYVTHADGTRRLHVDGKGRRERSVPVPTVLQHQLALWGVPLSGYVFPSPYGGHIAAHTVSKYIGRHLRSVGSQACAHMLRHLFAGAVYRRSHDVLLLQELLGHADPGTSAIYAAADIEDASVVVEDHARIVE